MNNACYYRPQMNNRTWQRLTADYQKEVNNNRNLFLFVQDTQGWDWEVETEEALEERHICLKNVQALWFSETPKKHGNETRCCTVHQSVSYYVP